MHMYGASLQIIISMNVFFLSASIVVTPDSEDECSDIEIEDDEGITFIARATDEIRHSVKISGNITNCRDLPAI